MGRPSSIAGTAIEEKVSRLLEEGLSISEVSKRTGAHASSVQRFSVIRKSQPARVVDDEPNAYKLLARLAAVADDARDVRRHARLSGSAYARAQAIRTEADLIEKLLVSLGIDNAGVIRALDDAYGIAVAVREHVLHDRYASDLINRLEAVSGLEDVAAALRGRMAVSR